MLPLYCAVLLLVLRWWRRQLQLCLMNELLLLTWKGASWKTKCTRNLSPLRMLPTLALNTCSEAVLIDQLLLHQMVQQRHHKQQHTCSPLHSAGSRGGRA